MRNPEVLNLRIWCEVAQLVGQNTGFFVSDAKFVCAPRLDLLLDVFPGKFF